LESAKARRISKQIEPDGSMPRELARTKSWSYSLLNLTGMFHLARLGEHVGVDLWNYRTPDGRSIRGALDWMFPYATGKPWGRRQTPHQNFIPMVWLLRQAAFAYKNPAYEQAIARLPDVKAERLLITLLNPPPAIK